MSRTSVRSGSGSRLGLGLELLHMLGLVLGVVGN
jgi:hypothetical protein